MACGLSVEGLLGLGRPVCTGSLDNIPKRVFRLQVFRGGARAEFAHPQVAAFVRSYAKGHEGAAGLAGQAILAAKSPASQQARPTLRLVSITCPRTRACSALGYYDSAAFSAADWIASTFRSRPGRELTAAPNSALESLRR